ncbi:TIGR00374 family protein [Actinoplanes sp. ATCC 53533]|uniref:lysylphosphatidylglycerol synthase transmembrane domain-containing protein n=1 Tax=Actinoplanes sp. ATCC 53533 TaxID=1288362 RepID=UPI000F79172B|nr:lysylphosphatidylglycerol synthase transmembrane domain-containing protein [Actinoplanes sp. ATCC 53533]RSM68464.1 TIGR00374 family protein [Actinoplanes sp. ATCC 53533]
MSRPPSEVQEHPAEVSSHPGVSRWFRLALVGVSVGALAVVGLRGRLPDPGEFIAALAGAGYGWVAVAALLQVVSLAAFAFQQQRLLDNLGVRLRVRRLMAITLARSALSISLPAGAAVSTGYAIREYQKAGVSRRIGAASAVVSGLASIGGLTLLYVVGGAGVLARDPDTYLSWRPLVVVAALAGITTAGIVLGRWFSARPRRTPAGPSAGAVRDSRAGRLVIRLLGSARGAWQAGAGLRVRDWAVALAYAAVNWLTDLLCLAAATRALGLPVGVTTLAGIYLGVQIVRQVPLTPGGVGVVETALVAGLTASGATAISAAAAVLIYRLISCWLIIPAGGLAAIALRRATTTRPE